MLEREHLDARELARCWQSVLGRLQLELNPHNYATWLAGTRAVSFDGAALVVEARSAMACDWLDRRMRLVIERAAAQAFGGLVSLAFVTPGAARPEAPSPAPQAPPPAAARQAVTIGTVNCSYTFEDYLTTRGNELAVQACRSIVEPSDFVLSPVVLYGSPGMGKTHLLHALACRAQAAGRRVACLSAEEFANRFLGALRGGRAEDFKDQLRTVDLLIIDDLQALAGKKTTIDELVCTMDQVCHAGGHVVAASERHPFELGLPERLESRLAAGIITRVEPFDARERREFIEHVARCRRAALPGWAVDRIGALHGSSVRVLLGAVNVAMALERQGKLDLRSLDAAIAGHAVAQAVSETGEKDLIDRVARHFAVAADDILGRGRSPKLVEARAVVAAGLQARGYSLSRMGAVLGARDKTTMSTVASRGRTLLEERGDLRALVAV